MGFWRYHKVEAKKPVLFGWAFVLEQNRIEVYTEQKTTVFARNAALLGVALKPDLFIRPVVCWAK